MFKRIAIYFKNAFHARMGSVKTMVSTVMLALLGLLIILEVIVLQRSVFIILSANDTPPDFKPTKGVRIDFEAYKFGLNRIQNSAEPEQLPEIEKNPFIQVRAKQ